MKVWQVHAVSRNGAATAAVRRVFSGVALMEVEGSADPGLKYVAAWAITNKEGAYGVKKDGDVTVLGTWSGDDAADSRHVLDGDKDYLTSIVTDVGILIMEYGPTRVVQLLEALKSSDMAADHPRVLEDARAVAAGGMVVIQP